MIKWLLKTFKRPSAPFNQEELEKGKFLIIKTSSLGDIIHTFGVVSYLKKKFPRSTIDWIVEKPYSELLKAHPYVNEAIPVNTKKWRRSLFSKETRDEVFAFEMEMEKREYDVIFDLQGNLKSGLIGHLTEARQRVGFGPKSVAEWPNCIFSQIWLNPKNDENIRDTYLSIIQQYFKDESPFEAEKLLLHVTETQKKTIDQLMREIQVDAKEKFMFCPGSYWANKQLSFDSILQFIKQITHHYPAKIVLIWGNEKERDLCENILAFFPKQCLVLPRLPLPMLQHLMMRMDAVISMDSLPLHLAATTDVPTFSLFGPSSAKKYRPKGNQHQSFQGSCPYGRKFEKRCPLLRTCPTGACLRSAKGVVIFQRFQQFWENLDSPKPKESQLELEQPQQEELHPLKV